MADSPLVSILIPAHNAKCHIVSALDSVLAQTYSHLEVIVVDDGSQDGTLNVLRDFPRGNKLTIIEQDNAGAAAARNRAFAASKGDFVKFFDADDLLEPTHIARQVESLQGAPECVAMSEWDRFYADPSEASFESRPSWRNADPVSWIVEDWSDARPMTQPGMFLIPRTIAERAGPWDERLSLTDDFEYFARVILASGGVRFTPGARLYYRSGLDGSLSRQRSRKAIESAFLSLTLGTQHLLEAEDSLRTRRAAANVLQDFIYTYYPSHADLITRAQQRIAELGGSTLPPSGPPGFEKLKRFTGWRVARRVQRLAESMGLNRAARQSKRRSS